MKVVAVDASQIEARLAMWICGQQDVVDQFARKEDVYCNFGAGVFGRTITKADVVERFISKEGVLGLQYRMWWPKFQRSVRVKSVNLLGQLIDMPDTQAQHTVETYRHKMHKVKQGWADIDNIGIPTLAGEMGDHEWQFGPMTFTRGVLKGPTGLNMYYPNMERRLNKYGKLSWSYRIRDVVTDLHSGKVLENICQHLAGRHTMDAAVRIAKRSRRELHEEYDLALQVHDENVFVVKDEHAEPFKQICLEEMRHVDDWATGCPFDAEAGIGQNYGEAK